MPSSGEKEVYSTKLHSRVGIIPKVQLPGDINVKSTIIPSLYAGLAREGRGVSSSLGKEVFWELGGGRGIGVGVTIRVSIYQLLVCWS